MSVYKRVKFKDKILQDLAEVIVIVIAFSKIFSRKVKLLKNSLSILQLNIKTTNLGKTYLLPKIHKRLYDVPGRTVTSNWGTHTEKTSGFLDNQLK